MSSNITYGETEICEAIAETGGLLSVAARRLGCDRTTIYERAKRSAKIQQAIHEAREAQKDFAEGKLYKLIREDNLGAICFYLKTQAKDRGYVERQEIDHSATMTPDEARRFLAEAGIVELTIDGDKAID